MYYRYFLGLFLCWFMSVSFIRTLDNFVVMGANVNNERIEVTDKVEKSEFIIKNTFQEDLNLVWRKRSNSLLAEWDYSVCAYGQCSIGVPESGQFKKIEKGEEGFFALHLFPKGKIGSGTLMIDVYDVSNPEFVATLTFNIEVTE